MQERWQNLIDLIANPKATFTRLKSRPKWGIAFVAFCVLVVWLAWMVYPFTQRFLNPKYASRFSYIQLLGSTRATSMVFVAVSGIILGTLCAVGFSALFTVISRIFKLNEAVKFKHFFAAWWHSILINPLVFFINIAFLPVFRRVEDIETVTDIWIIPGMHMLVPFIENQYLLMFLSFMDLLGIWNIFVLTIAVATLMEVSRTKACLTAIVIWLLRVGIDVIFQVSSAS